MSTQNSRSLIPSPSFARPTGLSILSLLFAFLGLGLVFGGVRVLLTGNYTYELLVGMIFVADGWGLWRGKAWAWTLSVLIGIVDLGLVPLAALEPISIAERFTGTIVSLSLNLLMIYYVTRPKIMSFFGKRSVWQEFL